MAVVADDVDRQVGLELRVESVTLQFAGLRALDDVSFSVPSGRLAALIGPNGAGKSSMVNCCTGIYRPTEGRVFLGDTDVTRMRTNATRASSNSTPTKEKLASPSDGGTSAR